MTPEEELYPERISELKTTWTTTLREFTINKNRHDLSRQEGDLVFVSKIVLRTLFFIEKGYYPSTEGLNMEDYL